ncbi:MAG: D-glycero-beta-D-manno-heptose 1,7-bisphosphate 7-phosphatase [Candidatus Acidiferrales bacterium]
MIRTAFLDRDGIINRKALKGDYITRWEDFHILPGVIEGITLLNQAGFSVVIVTNQRGIAKGLMTIADLETIHARMSDNLTRAGATIDGIYYCPHGKMPVCDCRKPAPGMLLQAARERDIDLAASWMIGDSDIDIEAGKNAGCRTARLLETNETVVKSDRHSNTSRDADIVAQSFLDAVQQILRLEATRASASVRNSITI